MASDAAAPLTGQGGRSRRSSRSNVAAATCNLLIFVALCGAVVATSVLFNSRIRNLSFELSAEKARIGTLERTVADQASVIARFNESVTNSDVLTEVENLKDQLKTTESEMNAKLSKAQSHIQSILDDTLAQLNDSVTQAQAQIQSEVDRVKGDVDSYVRTTQDQFSMENSFMVYQLAGTFTLLASLISMWHMTAHLRKFHEPFVQRKILAILWMSPVYGITSWLSLVFPMYEGYFAVIKDFYEAYVIYQFLSFLIAVLGKGDRNAVVDLLARHADHLKPPFRLFGCCLPNPYDSPRSMADAVLLQCQTFTMQFVFFRPLTTIGIFACNKAGYYGPWATSATDYRSPQFWLVMVQNLSVFVAFSGLLKFYHAVHTDLEWCRPFPKFLCIKGIVFMTFWQGLAIAILANTLEGTPNVGEEDPELWAKQAQNFLICLEMLLFSIAHFYCFPTEEWEAGYRPVENSDAKFGDNIALHDFFQDLKLVLRQGKKRKKKKSISISSEKNADNTQPPSDEEEGGESSLQNGNLGDGGNADTDGFIGSYDDDEGEDDIKLSDIEDTLEGSDVPEDVREATARLLHSIQDLAFEPPRTPSFRADETKDCGHDETRMQDEEQGQIGKYTGEDITSNHANVMLDADNARDIGGALVNTDDDEPGETTRLLRSGSNREQTQDIMGGGTSDSGTSRNDELLHPSIFTNLGAMNKFT